MPTRAKPILVAVLAALVLAVPARAAEIAEQPQSVRRGETVRITGTGEAPASVVVERRHGLFWLVTAGDVLVEREADGAWSATWRTTYFSPSGTHRIRVGEMTSAEFRVLPCNCIIPNQLRARWRDGRFRLSITAEYLSGLRVTTGQPVVRVHRDGRRIGSVRLRYRRGKFRGSWRGSRGARHSMVFALVSLADGFKNR